MEESRIVHRPTRKIIQRPQEIHVITEADECPEDRQSRGVLQGTYRGISIIRLAIGLENYESRVNSFAGSMLTDDSLNRCNIVR